MDFTNRTIKADAAAGILAILFGASVLIIGWNYPMGTATNMGPGYMPRVLGALTVALGVLLALRRTSERIGTDDIDIRSILGVLAGVLIFAGLIDTAGLPLAIFASVLVSSIARPGAEVKTTLLLALVIAAVCTGLFVSILGLPMRLSPWN